VVQNNEWKLMIYNNVNALLMMPFVIWLAGEVMNTLCKHVFLWCHTPPEHLNRVAGERGCWFP